MVTLWTPERASGEENLKLDFAILVPVNSEKKLRVNRPSCRVRSNASDGANRTSSLSGSRGFLSFLFQFRRMHVSSVGRARRHYVRPRRECHSLGGAKAAGTARQDTVRDVWAY